MTMSGQPTVIYHAANLPQAHILKGVLEERGIAAWIVNDAMQIAGGELPLGWNAAPCVVVGDLHAEEARRIAAEFDRTTAHGPTPDDASAEPPDTGWKDWPVCPQCQARRQARCPICESGGTDFPLAAIEERNGEPLVLLICESCDDHFRPEFFRLCHQCGHDYGDGVSVGDALAAETTSVRTWIVMGCLAAIAVVTFGYFFWLWRLQQLP
jgi:hypothetical protein